MLAPTTSTTNGLEFRVATDEDIPVLIDLRIDFLVELYGKEAQPDIDALKTQLFQYFSQAITNKTYYTIICASESEIVGVGALLVRTQPGHILFLRGRTGYIMNMYTKPPFRRRGIGQDLLGRLIDLARTLGMDKLELHASKFGEKLYRKNHFTTPKNASLELLL
jgi:GNAT superfamily N-acetyltransferase